MIASAEAGAATQTSGDGPVPGAIGLFATGLAGLLLNLASTAFFQLVSFTRLDILPVLEAVSKGLPWVWGGIAAVECAFLARLARGREGTPALLPARLALACGVLQLVWQLGQLAGIQSDAAALQVGAVLVWFGGDAALWFTVVRSSALVAGGGTALWLGARGLLAAWALVRTFLPHERLLDLFRSPVGTLVHWGTLGVSTVLQIVMLVLLVALARGRGGTSPAPEAAAQGSRRAADLVVGAVWLTCGVAVTIVSYASAKEGGSYVVATGAIVYGLVRIVRGLARPA